MMRHWSRLLLLAFAAVSFPAPAEAQTDDLRAAYAVFGMLIRYGGSATTHEQFILRAGEEFGRIGVGRETISESDLTVHRRMIAASRSATYAAQTMSADIDRDGSVTEDELLAALAYEHRGDQARRPEQDLSGFYRDEVARTFESLDTNEDGSIVWEEAASTPRVEEAVQHWGERARADIGRALAFDADDDGEVTRAEFRMAADLIFAAADLNSDDVLSEDESRALLARIRSAP